MSDVHEYQHEDGRTWGAYAGTETDSVLAQDPEWTLVGERDLADQAAPEPESEPEPEPEPDGLEDKQRSELDQIAFEAGVAKPHSLPNKDAVIAAIRAARDDEGGGEA